MRAALAALVLASAAGITAAAPALTTAGGALTGIERDGVSAYLGIPYAVPPVGSLRWRPPQGLPHWSGVRAADHYGNDCLQVRRPPRLDEQRPASEDCLYLNVWAPAGTDAARRPVMVWVHGGGFFAGSGSQPLYEGASLARRGVVLVTLNYRLGRFGFFAHPALARESPAGPLGNYGLLDQIAALKWVAENIAAFGGDPHNVTLCGQSAGGASVSYLLESPLARGLFQKAIIESGIFRGAPVTLEQAERAGEAAAKAWGAQPDANALRGVSSLQVLTSGPPGRVGPMIDGRVVPEDVTAAFAAGHVAQVPLLIGSNSYESGFFPAMAPGLSQRYAARWPEVTAVFDGYGSHETAAIEAQLATDQLITAPTWSVARAAAAHGLPTYLYYFSYVRPSQRGQVPGASHIDEVYALFDKMSLVEKGTGPDTQRIVDEVQSRWVQFARSGRPSAKAAEWPAVSAPALRLLEFTNTGPRVRSDFAAARLKLAESLAASAGTQ